jgi:hypothetical protein
MMHEDDALGRVLMAAKSKSDLHRAIDALPDDATLLLIADACCCGDLDHERDGAVLYSAAFGEPSLVAALGLLRLTEHHLLAQAAGG